MEKGGEEETKTTTPSTETVAKLVLIGAGWWSQGWHLPHLQRNDRIVKLLAIVDASDHPQSNLNPNLESLESLSTKYQCPTFKSVEELLESEIGSEMDGVIVCTPHSTHYTIGKCLMQEATRRLRKQQEEKKEKEGAPLHILMEKPMTTNVSDARKLFELVSEYNNHHEPNSSLGKFFVNHTANYRIQARMARSLIGASHEIGNVTFITAQFIVPLMWIFDDVALTSWNEPDPNDPDMIGNGFAWGQSSHLLAWIYHACMDIHDGRGCCPRSVYCTMGHSAKTGADLSQSVTIHCDNNIIINLSGTTLLPGNAHSDPPVPKMIDIKIFGTDGALFYGGNDRHSNSGRLELRRGNHYHPPSPDDDQGPGSMVLPCGTEIGFDFENLESEGTGPESLQEFIKACIQGQKGGGGGGGGGGNDDEAYVGATAELGYRTVQTIDAMYRSHASGKAESVL